jgi:hypothetical protein
VLLISEERFAYSPAHRGVFARKQNDTEMFRPFVVNPIIREREPLVKRKRGQKARFSAVFGHWPLLKPMKRAGGALNGP